MEITNETIAGIKELLPTYSAIYRISDRQFKTLFVSEKLPYLLGMEEDEYFDITGGNALNIVLEADRAGLLGAVKKMLNGEGDLDYFYRVYSNAKGFDWVHADAHICGIMEGDPVVIVRFANMSHEGIAYDTIINNSDRISVVIDRNTYEVLYANEAITTIDNFKNLANFKCFSLIKGRDTACEDCPRMQEADNEIHNHIEYNPQNNKWELLTWKRIEWCLRDAIVLYIQDVTKDKEYEMRLDRMNQMYQMAIEDAKEMMWIYDPQQHTITYQVDNPFTKAVCEQIGMPTVVGNVPDTLIGMVDEPFKEGFLKMFEVDSLEKSGIKFEYSSTVDGNTQWWRVSSRPIYDLNNKIKAVFCSGLNITEEKSAGNNYRSLLEQVSNMGKFGIASYRLNLSKNQVISGYTVYPEQYQKLQSGSAENHFKLAIQEICDDEIRHHIRENCTCQKMIEQYHQGVRQVTFEYPLRSQLKGTVGRIKWMRATNYIIFNPDSGDIEDISIVTDITRQKKNEKMLEYMANKGCDYLGLIDTQEKEIEFYSGSWNYEIIKKRQKINYAEAAYKLINSHVEIAEKSLFVKYADLHNIIERLKKENEIIIYYDFIEKDKVLKKQLKFSWLDDEHNEVIIIQNDITEAYDQERERVSQLKEALDKANAASQAKTEFLSRMSHDVRTPLNGIIGMTYLTHKMDLPKVVEQNLDKIRISSAFLLGIINDILDMTKLESKNVELELEPYYYEEFTDYIDAVIRPLCETKKQHLIVDTDPLQDYVPLLDIKKLNRINFNLLSNAVKYTPPGGTITLKIKEKRVDDDHYHFRVIVSDTGVGIGKEFQKHIFEPFTQENRDDVSEDRGTGLGLAIVKQLVNVYNGTISVESTKGKGTTFCVDLIAKVIKKQPLDIKKQQQEHEDNAYCLAEKHILVCEDYPLNQEIAETLLKQKQAVVRVVADGAQGIEAFVNSPLNFYDCILMDIRMPHLDGVEATMVIRQLERADAKTIPIVAMSADAFKEDIQKCLKAGMNAHIAKPIDPENLYRILVKTINNNKDL